MPGTKPRKKTYYLAGKEVRLWAITGIEDENLGKGKKQKEDHQEAFLCRH